MNKLIGLLMGLLLVISNVGVAFSKDVFVRGYFRKDGTYVQPHIRSSPDGIKSNNYGPSRSSSELLNPKSRDNDRDGIPNYLDDDDDNDGISDDQDDDQY